MCSYPDRRDHLNLTPLPVKPGTIITAKFASFILFVAAYTAAVSSLSMFAISVFLPRWTGDSLGSMGAYIVAHVASGAAAYTFVFLFFLFLEAVLAVLLGPRLLRAVSLALRFVLALAVVVALVLALTDVDAVQSFIDLAERTREARPASLLLWPPVWFVSMYEIIIGRSEPLYRAGANIGLAAILFLAVACRIALEAGYRRQARKAGEVRSRKRALAGCAAQRWLELSTACSSGTRRRRASSTSSWRPCAAAPCTRSAWPDRWPFPWLPCSSSSACPERIGRARAPRE